jgi:hypothetical protein
VAFVLRLTYLHIAPAGHPGYKHGLLHPCNVVLAKFCYKHTVILGAPGGLTAVAVDVFLNGCYIVLVVLY